MTIQPGALPLRRWRLLAAGTAIVAGTTLVAGAWAGAAAQSPDAEITIALVLNDNTNPVSAPLRKGAQDAADELGFELVINGPTQPTPDAQTALLQDMVTSGADGIILLPVNSEAMVQPINDIVDAGTPIVTTELDAPASKRAFFFFGGAATLDQGRLSAERVFATLTGQGATGPINFVITSCFPTVTGQQDRLAGFVERTTELNLTSPFQLFQVGFYDTTTDPARNLSNIQNIYTAQQGNIGLAYAMCGPDTMNWGKVLKQNDDHSILVAGYDWLPDTLDLIEEGWVAWAQGSSVYEEGNHTAKVLYDHLANGTPLPTGATNGEAVWADQSNLDEVRQSPDVTMAGG